MLEKIFLKFLFFLTCLLPAVTARLPLSDMFNFGIKEYIPYIVVATFFLFTMIPHEKFTNFRKIIFKTLEIFVEFIFPPVFFYMTEGFSNKTITLISFSCAIIGLMLLPLPINCYIRNSDSNHEKLEKFKMIISIALALVAISFPPVFSYVIEGFSATTIAFISISSVILVIIVMIILARLMKNPHDDHDESSSRPFIFFMSLTILIFFFAIFGLIIYLLVIFFKTDFNVKFHIPVLVINLVVGCCLLYCQGTK